MKIRTLISLNEPEIRQRVLLEGSCTMVDALWDPSSDPILLQLDYLSVTYVSFVKWHGTAPYPDMLVHLGWPGQVLHELFCRTPGMWKAFRKLVERSYGVPCETSLTEGDVTLKSIQELFVYRSLMAMSGVTSVRPYPVIPGGSGRKKADFLVTAVTGLSVHIELAMVQFQANGERAFLAEYRKGLLQKVELCREQGFDPLVIWADEAASPRMLAERLNDLRARLDLPTRPPAPLVWYERI